MSRKTEPSLVAIDATSQPEVHAVSLRLETLQIARLAPKLLDDSAELVRDFVLSLAAPGGGFVDRAGEPDLYYTVFGIECLLALQAEDAIAGLRASAVHYQERMRRFRAGLSEV